MNPLVFLYRFIYITNSEAVPYLFLIILIFIQVIDMLLFKGMEELMNIVNQSKQRHHIVGQYVVGNQGLVQDVSAKDRDASNFLKKFYSSNYS